MHVCKKKFINTPLQELALVKTLLLLDQLILGKLKSPHSTIVELIG
jgi:hypothetical protein